jgi:hypothetical protein
MQAGLRTRPVSSKAKGTENSDHGVATDRGALRSLGMRHLFRALKHRLTGGRPKTLADEQKAIPVVTLSPYRGDLALKHDRSQHRRYTAHFEDLQN